MSATNPLRLAIALLALALAPGCGVGGGEGSDSGESQAAWLRLAVPAGRGVESGGEVRAVFTARDGRTFRIARDGDGEWLETVVERSDWSPSDAAEHTWSAPVRVRGAGSRGVTPQRLTGGEASYRYAPPNLVSGAWDFPPDSFVASRKGLFLRPAAGREPPASLTLSVLLGGRRRLDDTWRVTGNRFSGEGFALRAGEAYEREVAIPAASGLRFATTVEPALLGESAEDVPVRFRVLLDGQTVFEHAAPDPGREAFAWHEVVLPAEGRSSARVRFEVDGGLAHSAFLAPVIGPAEVGAPGARLWTRRHPDIVLFLADTFRADNLQAYGGELSLTPFLDRLAGESLLFTRAWSASTHTLPAHAALFSGFYPHQVGVRDETTVLPDAVSTIAEHLSAAGYRTGAITDAVVVSDHRGLSQGFEWFDERQIGIRSTAERTRAFLDADDGRPVFLFVQTYRTHLPYRVSAATARQHGERLGIEQWNEPLQRELVARTRGASSLDDPAVARLVEKLQARYRGGVIDLDRALEGIVADLRARGMLANGYFVFTSDHGEAFGEHNVLYHQGTVWEELISVPLFIVGAGIEPGRIDAAASLVDLAPTLVEMAGRPPDPDWPGSSLLALGTLEDRPAFAFQATRRERSTVALIEGPHKLIGFEDPAALDEGRLLGAYELDRDPGERRNVAGKGDAWPAELMERLGPQARDLLTPRIDPEPALLDVERVDELRAMGYVE